jgi:hypothetical protein
VHDALAACPYSIRNHFNIMIPIPFIAIIASSALVALAFIFGPIRALAYLAAIASAILFGWLAFIAACIL